MFVALFAFFAAALFIRDLITSGIFAGLPFIAMSLFFGWKYMRIAATGRDKRITQHLQENNPPSAH
jgi:hypothetical protein